MNTSKKSQKKKRAKYASWLVKADKSSEPEIFYEFDRAMNSLARLHHYANCLPCKTAELDERAERLCKDDLLNFSIHCRRLVSITKVFPLVKSVRIPSCIFQKKRGTEEIKKSTVQPGKNSWDIINAIVHYDLLQIWTSNWEVHSRIFAVEARNLFEISRKQMHPVVLLSSDKFKPFCFELKAFVKRVSEDFFDPLIDGLSDKEIYVEFHMREL